MSYLEIPITAVNGQSKYVIAKDDIMLVRQGDATLPNPTAGTVGTTVSLFLDSGLATQEVITFTHTQAAAGFNVADIISDTITGNPGGIVAKVGGIPATVSASGQALSFVQFSAPVLA